jgi:hypothetical protein
MSSRFISRLAIVDKRISKCEGMSIEPLQIEMKSQGKKRRKRKTIQKTTISAVNFQKVKHT